MKTLFTTIILSLLLSAPAFAAEMSIADIHDNMKKLEGKQVTFSGKVVKVNNGIMRRNFLHVETTKKGKGSNQLKLIVTSGQTANVGQNVTVTGTVVLNTDFGMGYKYPLLVEKSSIKINK